MIVCSRRIAAREIVVEAEDHEPEFTTRVIRTWYLCLPSSFAPAMDRRIPVSKVTFCLGERCEAVRKAEGRAYIARNELIAWLREIGAVE